MRIKLVKGGYEYKEQIDDMLEEWTAYNNENPDANSSTMVYF